MKAEEIKANMKQPMTAEKWFKEKQCRIFSNGEIRDITLNEIQQYSDYLLKHHLEQFAEECKVNSPSLKVVVSDTLDAYLTKNNI